MIKKIIKHCASVMSKWLNGKNAIAKDDSEYGFHLIDTEEKLHDLINKLRNEKEIAVDLESNSLYSYHARICLMQISTRKENYVVDTLLIKNISDVDEIFSNARIRKVLHGAYYDVEMFYKCAGIQIRNLFDTQIAASFTGETKTGLSSLVEKNFGVHLEKKYQKSNWAIRPLPPAMIQYAISDTKYLLPLFDILKKQLNEKNRFEWVIEECELLTQSVIYEKKKTKSIKGTGKVPKKYLPIVEAIIEFRENIAKEKDIPPFRILDRETIFKIATMEHPDIKKLRDLTVRCRMIQKHIPEILEIIKNARNKPVKNKTIHKKKVYSNECLKRSENLHLWRLEKAKLLGIQPHLILSHQQIDSLVSMDVRTIQDIEKNTCLKKWQKTVFGKDLYSILTSS